MERIDGPDWGGMVSRGFLVASILAVVLIVGSVGWLLWAHTTIGTSDMAFQVLLFGLLLLLTLLIVNWLVARAR